MKVICSIASVFLIVLLFCCIATATSSDPNSKPTHDIAITNVSVPNSCVQGDTVTVKVSVANKGSYRETFRIALTDTNSDKEIADKELTLAKGWKDGSEDVADLIFDAEETGIQQFGDGIRSIGDINKDGYDDMLICATKWHSNRGSVSLYYGGSNIDTSHPAMTFYGEDPNDHLGDCVGFCSGDVNGDGNADIMIGVGGFHDFDGRVDIHFGGPTHDMHEDLVLYGQVGQEGGFGCPVISEDIDNDGYDDVIVGAQLHDHGRGRVYLFWGEESMDTTADFIFEGEGYPGGKHVIGYGIYKVQGWFGRKIVASGDVNGDGYNDILVGARHAFDRKNNGSAYLFFGDTKQKMDEVCDCVFRGEEAKDEMGSSLELFDIDNDGYSDVIVGARGARNWRGAVYIWWGKREFIGDRPADIVLEGEPYSNMGGDEIVCGYFNDDPYGDILAGAYNYPSPTTRRGRAYIFYGNKQSLIDTSWDHVFEGELGSCYQYFGIANSAGDFNNDKYDDVVIGAWGYKNDQGRAYLYYGPFSNTTDITCNWDTTNVTPGKHILKATIAPVAGEEDTTDNTVTMTIEVKNHSKLQ